MNSLTFWLNKTLLCYQKKKKSLKLQDKDISSVSEYYQFIPIVHAISTLGHQSEQINHR